MRGLTERQIQRREAILAAARKLITKHGHEGVTMRQLAKQSGVAPKTLYHQFGSKEKLLRTAVEERFRYLYQMIDEENIGHGIDRLYFIIDAVAATTQKNLAYAKALTPMLKDASTRTFTAIRMNTYRRAIDQIAGEGDFVPWANIDLLASIVYRQVNPIYLASWYTHVPQQVATQVAKLDLSLMLAAVTTGYTHRRAIKTVKAMQKALAGSKYL